MKKIKKYRCKKCKKIAEYAPGIGHYCPNDKCPNFDFGLEAIK